MSNQNFEAPDAKQPVYEEAAMPYSPGRNLSRADAVKQDQEAMLMAIDGVTGVGIGQDRIGNEAIVVYVRDQGVAKQIPRELDNVPVMVEVTGVVSTLPL